MFAFGHGLSYSQFEYADLVTSEVSPTGDFTVSFKVTNVGQVEGREVAQLYISDPQSTLPRAVKELKQFVKVHLKPGESKVVKVALDREALGYYDDQDMNWVAESGLFIVQVGTSSVDIRLKGEVELKDTFSWTGL